jgi:hypothetical protein
VQSRPARQRTTRARGPLRDGCQRHLLELKRIINIVFDRDPDDRLDLFTEFPRLKLFFQKRRLHAAARTVGDLIFALIILSGLFGPQDPGRNSAIFMAWGLWWPTLVLSWFLVGRMWCGFCPFPGIGRIIQRLGLTWHHPVPKYLQKYGIYWAVALFGVIIWVEETTGIKESPRATAILILSILGGASLSAIFFPKQAWCRYLCPMGRMSGVAATMALMEFRPDHEKCRGCKTFACKRGTGGHGGCPVYLGAFNVRNNLDCLVCGHCIELCDRNSPQLNLRSPFTELVTNKGRFITCSYIIPFLMGSQLARFFQEGLLDFNTLCRGFLSCHMVLFSMLLVLGFLAVHATIRVGARFFGITEDELFGKFSPMVPVFVPMAFAGELVYRMNYTVAHAPNFFPTLGRQFGWNLQSWTFRVPELVFPVMDSVMLITSCLAGLYVLHKFVHGEFLGLVSTPRYRATQFLTIAMLIVYLVALPIWRI